MPFLPRSATLHARPLPEVAFLVHVAAQERPRASRPEVVLGVLEAMRARDLRMRADLRSP